MNFTDYHEIARTNIIRYRKLAKLNQKELGKRINRSLTTISNIENKNSNIHTTFKTYCLIAEALGVTIQDLLTSSFNGKITEPVKAIKNVDFDYKNFNYNKYYSTITYNIAKYRTIRNLTQEKLAEEALISTEFMSKIEIKIDTFSLDTLGRLADALNIDIRLLFEDE